MTRRTTTTNALLAGALTLCLVLVGCGGGGDAAGDSDAPPATTATTAPTGTETSDTGGSDSGGGASIGGEIGDQLNDATGGGLDDAIASLPAETVWGIVADQLGDNVELDIDGTSIKLTLNEGSTDDAIMDCLIAGSFIEDGQTVTMVYPDGDVTCD